MHAHPQTVGDLAHLCRLVRRQHPRLDAFESGRLHLVQLVFGRSGDKRLAQLRLERQWRRRSLRCLWRGALTSTSR
jgi:hypothetical protein